MPRLTEKQKRDRARDRGEVVFEPLPGSTVKAMFNLIRNLYGNPHNLGSISKPFTDEYDWKQLQAKATYADYIELLEELAKTDERAYNKLNKESALTAYTFEQYKRENLLDPKKTRELKAKYNPNLYLINEDERQYITGELSDAKKREDEAFKAKSEAYFSQKSSAGPPSEAIALSTQSATQSAGGEPPRAQPRSTVSSRGRGRGGSVVSSLSRAQFEANKAEKEKEAREAERAKTLALPKETKDLVAKYRQEIESGKLTKQFLDEENYEAYRTAFKQVQAKKPVEVKVKQPAKPIDPIARAQSLRVNTDRYLRLSPSAQQYLSSKYAFTQDWLADLNFATFYMVENKFPY
jgi:hypothetical protein